MDLHTGSNKVKNFIAVFYQDKKERGKKTNELGRRVG